MALKTSIESPYNGDCEEAYIMVYELKYNNNTKTLEFKIVSCHDEASRSNPNKKNFPIMQIPIGNETVLTEDGILTTLGKSEFEGVYTVEKAYTILKTKKILYLGQVIDLTQAVDI